MSETDTIITTAAALGSYYKELTEAGIPSDLVDDLVRDAGHYLHNNEGVAVRNV